MNTSDCHCKKELDTIPSDVPSNFSEPTDRFLDFGTTEVGRKKWLKYRIQNHTERPVEYTITRDPKVNPLFQVFNFSAYKFRIPAKSSSTLNVSYRPMYPETGDVDCFQLMDSGNNVSRVYTRGMGAGPSLQISIGFLRFDTWDERKSYKHTVELRNESEIEALVHFDFDVDDPVFRIDTTNATIPARKSGYVNVTFAPVEYGVYGRRIACLVLHHEPLLLELFGVHSPKNELRNYAPINCPLMRRYDGSYKTYMQDVQLMLQDKPLFSLTENYIDFGGASEPSDSKTMVTSLTNHMHSNITVRFEEDHIFKVNPDRVEIPPSESVLFECTFTPERADAMYHKRYSGTVLWKDERAFSEEFKRLEIPMSFSLSLAGHSFYPDTFWIPQLEIIPEVIVLPPATPGASSYVTFQLKALGHLPVMFKCLPPKKTNFIIKPMLGLVTDYCLLIAQLQSDARKLPKVYTERWSIMLNGRTDHLVYFYLKGFSEEPSLVTGDQNRVKFACVQTGCKETILVPVKNNCQHRLRYSFVVNDFDCITIKHPVGELAPNETVHLEWCFQGTSNSCVKYTVLCVVHVLEKMRGVVGAPLDIPVDVYTESTFSELCCIPNLYDLGDVQCEVPKRMCVCLHNFGPTMVHYTLDYIGAGNHPSSLHVDPSTGTINPNGKNTVFVEFTPRSAGRLDVAVVYRIRKSRDSPEVLENYERVLFNIHCTSFYPYFQIVDVVHHNFGKLFSKRSLWEIFNIDELNRALNLLEHDQEKHVDVRTPDGEFSDESYFAVFLLKNVTPFPVDVHLKRRKVCDCKLLEVTRCISLRKKQFECPHRDFFSVSMENERMRPDSVRIMQFHICYTLQGEHQMSYEMAFPRNRRLVLDITIRSIGSQVLSKYASKFALTLSPVCLSEKDPQIQAFWLYNNQRDPVDYSLDLEEIDSINCVYESEIFKCLNPIGCIEAYTRVPLMFKFVPIKRKHFQVELPLRMGNAEATFLLSGDGSKSFRTFVKTTERTIPSVLFDVPATLSEDHVIVDPFPVWSSATVLVFIRNPSESNIIGYSWLGCDIDEFVEVSVEPRKGVLRPGDSQLVLIKVKSLGTPCKLRLQISCKLLNHSEYRLYKKSMAAYNYRQEQIQDEFIITEKGVNYPTNDIIVPPFPKHSFVAVCMDISVTGVADRDIHHTAREQLAHSPIGAMAVQRDILDSRLWSELPHSSQESLFTSAIFFERKEELMRKRKPCRGGWNFAESSSTSSSEMGAETIAADNRQLNVEGYEFCKHAIECLIADAVFSSLFFEILKKRRLEAPVYYEQVRSQRDDKKGASLERENCIQDLYANPPSELFADLFKELILKSLYEVFELNLQCKGV